MGNYNFKDYEFICIFRKRRINYSANELLFYDRDKWKQLYFKQNEENMKIIKKLNNKVNKYKQLQYNIDLS